jgi:hypothetical protein
MFKRLVDINGFLINEPQHYHESLKWAEAMIESMEDEKIDRSDMNVVINRLTEEIRFRLMMLKNRETDEAT